MFFCSTANFIKATTKSTIPHFPFISPTYEEGLAAPPLFSRVRDQSFIIASKSLNKKYYIIKYIQ